MQVWNVLHAARWKYRMQKNPHLGTIAQLCRAISSQLRHISTIRKKIVKQQYLLHSTCHHNMVNFGPLAAEIVSLVWGTPCKFQWVSRLGSTATARHSSIGRQPNFAALNRGRHLYLAGRTSRWALAHISSLIFTAWNYASMIYAVTRVCLSEARHKPTWLNMSSDKQHLTVASLNTVVSWCQSSCEIPMRYHHTMHKNNVYHGVIMATWATRKRVKIQALSSR